MHHQINLDLFEKWLPRRAALQIALGIWVAGFVVAGANAWRMRQPTAGMYETGGTGVDVVGTPTEAASDSTESEGVLMPIEVIVGRRTPKIGAALRQKP